MDSHAHSDWFWFERGGSALPVARIGLESVAPYGRAQRRVRLDLCGIVSVTAVAMIWFAFFLPTFYRRWVEPGSNAATSEHS